ncbi:hypothetical protein JTB14_035871 [Gonioctena quinquepunctata]|nr:hypothetical protein JTB14_035871 [Gonioctena quinquepunctata]
MDDKDADDNLFNRERILILLDLYKLYKPKVGRGEVKTVKKMWEKSPLIYPIDAGSPFTHQNVKINGKCWRDLIRKWLITIIEQKEDGRISKLNLIIFLAKN